MPASERTVIAAFAGMAFCRWLACVLFMLGFGLARAEPLPSIAIGFYTPVIRDLPRKDVEVSLRFWVEELARSLGLTYQPVQMYDNLAEMQRDMASGKLNFLVSTSMGVVRYFAPEELADGFAGYKSEPDHLLLVVRRDAAIRTPGDLSGKRIALMEGDELSDLYLETLLLKTWGKPDWKRLGTVSREQRSSKLAHRLFFDQADAALIYRNGYEAALALNPQLGHRLQVLDDYSLKIRSPHIGLFSAHMLAEHREAITKAALRLNETTRGRQVLQIYLADSLVRTSVKDLARFRELLETHRRLMAGAGKTGGGVK